MEIDERYHDLPISVDYEASIIKSDGSCEKRIKTVMAEHKIDVYINDILTMKLMCLPEYLTELVLGRMLTEGILKNSDEVKNIYVCEYGKWARVILNKDVPQKKKELFATENNFVETTQSCCTENHVINDLFTEKGLPSKVVSIPCDAEDIFFMAKHFADDTPLHKKTGATHSCFLYQNKEILFECEDIGRHNAIDKCLGYALRENIDVKKCMLYTSGRLSTDMVLKAVKAGLPVIVSKAAPSSDAIEIAKYFNLKLVCHARKDSYVEIE